VTLSGDFASEYWGRGLAMRSAQPGIMAGSMRMICRAVGSRTAPAMALDGN
jgi:hypothetical protein